jgi:hypothetical protein
MVSKMKFSSLGLTSLSCASEIEIVLYKEKKNKVSGDLIYSSHHNGGGTCLNHDA